ncbi:MULTISPECIES: TetR/AcrR family transcriptional regulator [unclassified Novosphingobium]|uniref:TetR/AcrR family transcriptional regulator n=1 Tax=unclassified Novosphingobium TaxID=2644732 RepID=UPI00020EF9E4|nr:MULTISPECIES: TetR/AcrR family transcriptional regulator [unclassified Novosphingobium]GFM28814.1 TetR/AcrR family transcriptional regulator [Novosphingobium sp. PY1]CCA90309.1 TetR/AcrR family transcriptional regulator [Novosphingobium sp. PP1Y]
MKAIRHQRGKATREAIVKAAETVFAEVGYGEARLEDIAAIVGVRRPSMVYYFAGKQELYDAVEADIFEAMHHFSRERLEGVTGPLEKLLALTDAWLDFIVARPTAARIIQRLIADVRPRQGNPIEFSHVALDILEDIVTEGVESGRFRPVSPMFVLNGVSGGILFYVNNSTLIGEQRFYEPSDPETLAEYRALLGRLIRAAVLCDAPAG